MCFMHLLIPVRTVYSALVIHVTLTRKENKHGKLNISNALFR